MGDLRTDISRIGVGRIVRIFRTRRGVTKELRGEVREIESLDEWRDDDWRMVVRIDHIGSGQPDERQVELARQDPGDGFLVGEPFLDENCAEPFLWGMHLFVLGPLTARR